MAVIEMLRTLMPFGANTFTAFMLGRPKVLERL
jgi:hypothetical protein